MPQQRGGCAKVRNRQILHTVAISLKLEIPPPGLLKKKTKQKPSLSHDFMQTPLALFSVVNTGVHFYQIKKKKNFLMHHSSEAVTEMSLVREVSDKLSIILQRAITV